AEPCGFEDRQVLAALGHRLFQLEGDVEMILDRALAPPGDEDHLLDPRLARFVDRILNEWPVDDGEHLLGYRLGGRQEARAEASDGKDGFANGFHARALSGERPPREEAARGPLRRPVLSLLHFSAERLAVELAD